MRPSPLNLIILSFVNIVISELIISVETTTGTVPVHEAVRVSWTRQGTSAIQFRIQDVFLDGASTTHPRVVDMTNVNVGANLTSGSLTLTFTTEGLQQLNAINPLNSNPLGFSNKFTVVQPAATTSSPQTTRTLGSTGPPTTFDGASSKPSVITVTHSASPTTGPAPVQSAESALVPSRWMHSTAIDVKRKMLILSLISTSPLSTPSASTAIVISSQAENTTIEPAASLTRTINNPPAPSGSTTSASEGQERLPKSHAGAIVGIVIGVLLLLAGVLSYIFMVVKRRRSRRLEAHVLYPFAVGGGMAAAPFDEKKSPSTENDPHDLERSAGWEPLTSLESPGDRTPESNDVTGVAAFVAENMRLRAEVQYLRDEQGNGKEQPPAYFQTV
ncbi:hypothetical protein DXG01_003526 [Tephrocybe rancida]|nr:hypothetical protein DXG01_003526 [Tephrocybe rancida]